MVDDEASANEMYGWFVNLMFSENHYKAIHNDFEICKTCQKILAEFNFLISLPMKKSPS